MPLQIFPPAPQVRPSRRSFIRWRWLVALVLLIAAALATLALTPLFLLNTPLGRRLLLAAANSTPDGHLDLTGAHLVIRPQVSLELAGLRLVRPYEPQAPTLAIGLLRLEGLSRQSQRPGQPLVAERATLAGIEAVIHQQWVQSHRGDGAPPDLPSFFPHAMLTPEVELHDVRYTVYQTRHGRPSFTRMSGIEARFKDFEWNFARMTVQGHGPLSAKKVELNGMTFTRLSIPDFRAEGDRLTIPAGRLEGLGGQVDISGAIRLEGGLPQPEFDIHARDLDLATIIASNPDGPRQAASPTGKVDFTAHIRSAKPSHPGEVPEPILDGQLILTDFKLPVRQKSRLAEKVLSRMPGYEAGEIPRLNLHTLKGGLHIAGGQVRLKNLEVQLGGLLVIIDGTIQQGTGQLDMRMWVAKGQSGLISEAGDREEASMPSNGVSAAPDPGAKAEAPAPVSEDVAAAPAPVPSGPASSPAPTPEMRPTTDLKSRLAAKRLELEARVTEAKHTLDSKAEQVRSDVKGKLDLVKHDIDAVVDPIKTDIQAQIEKQKAVVQAHVQEAKADFQARVAQVKTILDAKRDALLEALEARYGRPELCITGTTEKPVIKLCRELATAGE